MKYEMKSQAPAPAGGAAARSRTRKVLPVLAMAAASTACVHIQTGTHAGDCTHAVVRDFEGKRVPDVMHVTPYEGPWAGGPRPGECPAKSLFCAGEWDHLCLGRDEPCPVFEGTVVMREDDRKSDWYGPGENDFYFKPPLLTGKTSIFPATGTYDTEWGHGPRPITGRMTALITAIQTWDGKKVPVCGVLFGNDDKEGVPIFTSPPGSKPMGGSWGDARVRFFWPSNMK